MAKRKITVTVDEDLVADVQALGTESLSSVVNAALASEVERRARAAALGRMLAEWDAALGPIPDAAVAAAGAAFDDLDAIADSAEPVSQGRRRPGAA